MQEKISRGDEKIFLLARYLNHDEADLIAESLKKLSLCSFNVERWKKF
jgi:hypothetical protein